MYTGRAQARSQAKSYATLLNVKAPARQTNSGRVPVLQTTHRQRAANDALVAVTTPRSRMSLGGEPLSDNDCS